MLRKIGQSYQVAIPKEIVRKLNLKAEDYVDIVVSGGRIIMEPQVVVPKDQAYFYTSEWQVEESQAQKDIQAGRYTRARNLDQLFEEIDKE